MTLNTQFNTRVQKQTKKCNNNKDIIGQMIYLKF